MMGKHRASETTVDAFLKAVYPDMTELAIASSTEESCLRDATTKMLLYESVVDAAIKKKNNDHICPICTRFHGAPKDNPHHHDWCPLIPFDKESA